MNNNAIMDVQYASSVPSPISIWALIWSQAAAPLLLLLLTPLFNVIPSLLFRRSSFECSDGSSRMAMRYVLRHYTLATGWTVCNGAMIPVGYILCVRPRAGIVFWAHSTLKVGLRTFGEDHSVDVVIWWLRGTPPADLMSSEMPVPPPLADGFVISHEMAKLTSDYCAWELEEVHFNIANCTAAASVAAQFMLDVIRQKRDGSHVFYINGPTGTGKTTSAIILAHMMGGRFVEYDFTSSQCKFEKLIKDARPSEQHPLVVSVSEVDKKLEQIVRLDVKGKRLSDKRDVYDKQSMLKLYDDVNHRYPHVYLLQSGNTPFQQLQTKLCDAAYTRPSRMTVVNVGGDNTHDRDDACTSAPGCSVGACAMMPTTPDARSRGSCSGSDSEEGSNSNSDGSVVDEDL